jgi:hypothetical protein
MCFKARVGAFCAAIVVLGACNGAGTGDDRPKVAPSIRDLRTEDTTGPYVSVAVDNHFHDVHAEDQIQIAEDRPFIVENQGSNTHNVTIVGSEIDEDIAPGEEVEIDPVGELGIGPQVLICRIHANEGMTGRFVVVEEDAA